MLTPIARAFARSLARLLVFLVTQLCVAQLDPTTIMVVAVIPARAEYPGEATSLAPVVVLFYHFNLPCPSVAESLLQAETVIDSCYVECYATQEAGVLLIRRCQKYTVVEND